MFKCNDYNFYSWLGPADMSSFEHATNLTLSLIDLIWLFYQRLSQGSLLVKCLSCPFIFCDAYDGCVERLIPMFSK